MHSAIEVAGIIAGCIGYIMVGAWWRGYEAAVDNRKNLASTVQLSESCYWLYGAFWPVAMCLVLIKMLIHTIRLYPIVMSGYNVGTKHRNMIKFRIKERKRIAMEDYTIENNLNQEAIEVEKEIERALTHS